MGDSQRQRPTAFELLVVRGQESKGPSLAYEPPPSRERCHFCDLESGITNYTTSERQRCDWCASGCEAKRLQRPVVHDGICSRGSQGRRGGCERRYAEAEVHVQGKIYTLL